MSKVKVPALIVGVAVLVILGAGSCGPSRHVTPRESACPQSGCPVPVDNTEAVPATSVSSCDVTGNKGPCSQIWPDMDGVCRWWLVDVGHTFDDGTARDLGVWPLNEGEVCA